jgi:hypothetical protein
MYAILHCGLATVCVEFQRDELLVCGLLLSSNMGYPILGDFEESTQEPTVRFNIQPATQHTVFQWYLI